MGAKTEISWADATFNPWTGCEKVSPACDHCYAEAWAKRTGHPERWQGERAMTSAANWRQPIKWNREAQAAGTRRRVFCASLADVFDNQVPEEWRTDLWALIKATPHLDWMLLTKRIGNAPKMLPADWGGGRPNVWIGATVVNQEEADRDIPKLLAIPARIRFLSIEPMLGPIDLRRLEIGNGIQLDALTGWHSAAIPLDGFHQISDGSALAKIPILPVPKTPVDWVIAGGESGAHARPMHPDWVRSLRDQCQAAGVPFHFKQWGAWAPDFDVSEDGAANDGTFCRMERVGKAEAGRTLDGRTWDEFPT